MATDRLAEIAAQLQRIGAGPDQAGETESIGVNDEGDGWASLGASEQRRDLYWYGPQVVLLQRLARLASGAGPDAVRAEFRVELPDHLNDSR
jgi:hypothetical protein